MYSSKVYYMLSSLQQTIYYCHSMKNTHTHVYSFNLYQLYIYLFNSLSILAVNQCQGFFSPHVSVGLLRSVLHPVANLFTHAPSKPQLIDSTNKLRS